MAMRRRTIGAVSGTLLLPSALATITTGILAHALDLNDFVLHMYAGYLATVLALVHVVSYWPSLVAFWTGRRGPRRTARATRTPAGTPAEDAGADRGGEETPAGHDGGHPSRRIGRRTVLAAAGAGAAGVAAGWLIRPGDVLRRPGEDFGALYHRASAPGFTDVLSALVDWGGQPPPTKTYPGAAVVTLPRVTQPPRLTVAAAIGQRRSLRRYADRPMTLVELSWLMGSAAGITGGDRLRAAPSAGAQYPIETYVAATRVDGLAPGIYHYAPHAHTLSLVRAGRFGGDLMVAALGQDFVREAPVVVVLSAIFQRLRWRYRDRAYRYALIEAGHIGQNVYLAAEAVGYGACVVAAFIDDALNGLLGIDGADEAALVILPVGARRS